MRTPASHRELVASQLVDHARDDRDVQDCLDFAQGGRGTERTDRMSQCCRWNTRQTYQNLCATDLP